ncbi:MAG: hypothetical protein ABSF22_20160, partial [Bryobacteraceae bacterium]
ATVIDIGSEVESGQLLATLDIPELEAELAEKKALFIRAKVEKAQAEKELIVAESQVTTATSMVTEADAGVFRADTDVVRWKAELDQVNTQISGGVGDTQTRNVVTKSWDAAKAAKMEAEAKVATAKALVLERKARKERAAADVGFDQRRPVRLYGERTCRRAAPRRTVHARAAQNRDLLFQFLDSPPATDSRCGA